eukprot:scaffold641_cov373-Pavlova_lutheri.AAC.10
MIVPRYSQWTNRSSIPSIPSRWDATQDASPPVPARRSRGVASRTWSSSFGWRERQSTHVLRACFGEGTVNIRKASDLPGSPSNRRAEGTKRTEGNVGHVPGGSRRTRRDYECRRRRTQTERHEPRHQVSDPSVKQIDEKKAMVRNRH